MKTQIITLLVILTFALASCQKLDGIDSTTDLTTAQLKSAAITVNDVAVESVSEEVNYEAEFYAEYVHLLRQLSRLKGMKGDLLAGKGGMQYGNDKAPAVSIDTAETGYPITITINYGDGTVIQTGRVISGIVTVEISAEKNTDGATRTITYTNCTVDSIGINGTCTIIFNGDNTTTRKKTTTSDITFTLADGTVIDRVGSHVREWIEGLATEMDHSDDMIQITGSVEVQSSTGDLYNRTIIEPLIKLGDCRHHVQGTVQISQNGAVIAVLDYGTGECDEIANLTTGGETIEIDLHGKMPKAAIENRQEKDNKHGKGN